MRLSKKRIAINLNSGFDTRFAPLVAASFLALQALPQQKSYGGSDLVSRQKKAILKAVDSPRAVVQFGTSNRQAMQVAATCFSAPYSTVISTRKMSNKLGTSEILPGEKLAVNTLKTRLDQQNVDLSLPDISMVWLDQTVQGERYTPQEIHELAQFCKSHGIKTGIQIEDPFYEQKEQGPKALARLTHQAGMDSCCFGFQDKGGPFASACILFPPDISAEQSWGALKSLGGIQSKLHFMVSGYQEILDPNALPAVPAQPEPALPEETFESDTHAHIDPAVFDAIQHAISTVASDAELRKIHSQTLAAIKALFGTRDATVLLTASTCQANKLALALFTKPATVTYCSRLSHLVNYEVDQPTFILETPPDGKLTPDLLSAAHRGLLNSPHKPNGSFIWLDQPLVETEYTPEEIKAICTWAHQSGLKVGADLERLINVVAEHPEYSFADYTTKAGLDAATFGSAKNGGPLCSALILFDADPGTARRAAYILEKIGGVQDRLPLLSSGFDRFVSASQSVPSLAEHNARQANEFAKQTRHILGQIPGIKVINPKSPTNLVFAELSADVRQALEKAGYRFSPDMAGVSRFAFPYDTTPEGFHRLIRVLTPFRRTPSAA